MSIAATITEKSINVVIDGRMRTIPKGHINFTKVEKILRDINKLESEPTNWRDAFRSRARAMAKAESKLRKLLDVPLYIEKATAGRVKVTDKGVLFNDVPLHNAVARHIMKLLAAGQNVVPMATFLDRLMNNPIGGVREDLYAWIESSDLALTPDGCFLAFKKVKANYASGHRNPDGTELFNHVGSIVSMPREQVDADRDNTCSTGLHFCSWTYLNHFGVGGESKVVIVKIAPEDVVAIPTDYDRAKGRAWKYEVVGEVAEVECEHLFADKPLVSGVLDDPLGDVDFDDDDYFDDWNDDEDDLYDDEEFEDALQGYNPNEEDDHAWAEVPNDDSYDRYLAAVPEKCLCDVKSDVICRNCVTFEDWDEAQEEEVVDNLDAVESRPTEEKGRMVPVYHNGVIVRYEIVDE